MENSQNKKRKERQASSESDVKNTKTRKLRQRSKSYVEFTTDSDSDLDRDRTPSGTVIPKKVEDIRTFFLAKAKSLSCESVQNSQGSKVKAKSTNRDAQLRELRMQQPASKQVGSASVNASMKNQHDYSGSEEVQTSSGMDADQSDNNNDSETNFLHQLSHIIANPANNAVNQNIKDDERSLNLAAAMESSIEKRIQLVENEMENQDMDDQDPPLMKVTTVLKMFREIKEEIRAIGSQVSVTPSDQQVADITEKCTQNAVDSINLTFQQDRVKIDSNEKQVQLWKKRSETLSDICNRMSFQMKDLDQRLENLELNNSKKMVIVSGLEEVDKDYMIEFLEEFILMSLDLKVTVDDYFMIGTQNPRQIVITLQSTQEKKKILKAKALLKHVKDRGRSIYINDYIPPAVQEKRRRNNDVQAAATKLYGEEKVHYTKAGLTINGKPYRKKVSSPTPKELIDIEPMELERIFKMKITKASETIKKEGSFFTGFTAPVKSHKEVRDLYVRLKISQPAARHIVCAYWIEQDEDFYGVDYVDDEEYGAGETALRAAQN